MTLDRAVLMFAGFVVLLGLALGYFVHPGFLLLSAFAGVNIEPSAFPSHFAVIGVNFIQSILI